MSLNSSYNSKKCEKPSPENNVGIAEENKATIAEEKEVVLKATLVGLMVTIGIILGGIVVYFNIGSQTLSNNFTNDDDELVRRLHHTFYTEEDFFFSPTTVEPEYITVYTNAIKEMQKCTIDGMLLHYFYGESGIGKSTMLHEVLKTLKPLPYVFLNIERRNSWQDVGSKLNISSVNEKATEQFVFETLTLFFKSLERDVCPLVVIDGANRNPMITNTFIAYWREISSKRPFGLLMVSSGGISDSISMGGGRVIRKELLPSETFAREYLKGIGISNATEIAEIMEITGNKIVYLRIMSKITDLSELQEIVHQNIWHCLEKLRRMDNAYRYFVMLVRALISDPSNCKDVLETIPGKEAKNIFKSNLLRRYHNKYTFQNKAVERYFKKFPFELLKTDVNITIQLC